MFPNYHQDDVLKIDVIGKSIPGELYCLSSEPLSKNGYLLNLILNLLYASTIALSDGVFSYFVNIQEWCFSSPMELRLNPPITFAFNYGKFLLRKVIAPIVSGININLIVFSKFFSLEK